MDVFKRNKICVTFDELVDVYNDDITLSSIIDLANIILQCDVKKCRYMTLQKCFNNDDYGVLIISNKDVHLEMEKLFGQIQMYVSVFGYMINDEIYYLTKQTKMMDLNHEYSINSFVQTNKYSNDIIHEFINENIIKDNFNFLGIGGEMKYYYEYNKEFLNNIQLITNNQHIYNDCLNLNVKYDLVNYKELNISDYYLENSILLINISKKGLQHLAEQINNLIFKQILYIGCCDKYVKQDIANLNNYTITSYKEFDIHLGIENKRFLISLSLSKE
jgi:hypothetical protein